MTTSKKKYLQVRETLCNLDMDFFSDTIVKIMAELQGFKDDYPDHTDLAILIDHDYDSRAIDVNLVGTRLETDKERNKRLAKARKERERKVEVNASREAAEKAEFFRLVDKFGHLL